ncbi:hypothetical protein P3S67_015793 [Capsicum chacoense]
MGRTKNISSMMEDHFGRQLQVFSLDKYYWFIPAYSEEDLRRIPALHGLEYPSNPELES